MSSSETTESEPIPYLCVLTLLRFDLLKRLIDCIDYPVNNVVILFQGPVSKDKINFTNVFVKKLHELFVTQDSGNPCKISSK